MKKNFIFIVFIIICMYLTGCSDDEYSVERKYWYANKEAEKIFKNPHASPPQQLKKAADILKKFSEDNPEGTLVTNAEFTIARLYLVKEEYETARTQLKTIMNKYSDSKMICSEALFFAGNAYELEGNEHLALKQYKQIIENYPVTPQGLRMPVYIAQFYKARYRPEKMIAAYKDAARHYKAVANQYPDTKLSFAVYDLASQCYIAVKDWKMAINTLNTMLERYEGITGLDGVLGNMALIYKNELKDNDKAKEMLERLVKEYPKSRLTEEAKKLLKEM